MCQSQTLSLLGDSIFLYYCLQWRIQGGTTGTCPPSGSRFFHFDIQIFRNVAASGVGAPPTRSAPPLPEILDPLLVCIGKFIPRLDFVTSKFFFFTNLYDKPDIRGIFIMFGLLHRDILQPKNITEQQEAPFSLINCVTKGNLAV